MGQRRGRRARAKAPPTVRRRILIGLRRGFIAFFALSAAWVLWHRVAPVHGTPLMGMRHLAGQDLRTDWVRIEDVSPELVRAVIAAEDTRFCQHGGFDLDQIRQAASEARAGGRVRGASTISQQTAKNVFLWPGGGYLRKGIEAWLTTLEEVFWSKRRIMEVYLNVAEWGDGLFGAEAAAQARFGKPASALTAREASLMAAVLPNPKTWRVDPPGPYVANRARTLRGRMATVRRDGLASCVLDER